MAFWLVEGQHQFLGTYIGDSSDRCPITRPFGQASLSNEDIVSLLCSLGKTLETQQAVPLTSLAIVVRRSKILADRKGFPSSLLSFWQGHNGYPCSCLQQYTML